MRLHLTFTRLLIALVLLFSLSQAAAHPAAAAAGPLERQPANAAIPASLQAAIDEVLPGDAAGLNYPQEKLTPADAPGDAFGFSVALNGNGTIALVGAYGADIEGKANQGAAYIFVCNNYDWELSDKISADDGTSKGEANDRFGMSVDLSADGSTALVGAYQSNVNGKNDQGSAYVFVRTGNEWLPQARLVATDGAADDKMGWSVALSADGNTAMVSAHRADIAGNTDQGTAYAFLRTGANWAQQDKLLSSDGIQPNAYIGYSVALSDDGDTALLGATGFDGFDLSSGTVEDAGYAFLCRRSSGHWSFAHAFTAVDPAANDSFGRSVALAADGTIALIGASSADVGGQTDRGAAYAFARINSNWSQWDTGTKLTAPDGAAGDHYGVSVSLLGNGYVAYIGAYQADVDGKADQGAVYSYTLSTQSQPTTWAFAKKFTAASGAAGDQYGVSVTIGGGTLLIGATQADVAGNVGQGAAYALMPYQGGTLTMKLTGTGKAEAHFGKTIAISLDGNTAIVGTTQVDTEGYLNLGAAYIFTRTDTGWAQEARLTPTDDASLDWFGSSVALSGDGKTALVGSIGYGSGASDQTGAAYIFTRSSSGWAQEARLLSASGQKGDWLGSSVALSRYGSIALVGAQYGTVDGKAGQGKVVVFTHSGSSWSEGQTLTTGAAGDHFGSSLDLDEDANTAIIGAESADVDGHNMQGAAYIFTRTASSWSQQTRITLATGADNDTFGTSVAISADGNTALASAPHLKVNGNENQGVVFVYTRSGSQWTVGPTLTVDGASNYFGIASGISADGSAILVGARGVTVNANEGQGAAYLFRRNGSDWGLFTRFTASDGQTKDYLGSSVAINGDGSIVLAAASSADMGTISNLGAVYAYTIPLRSYIYLPLTVR